MAERNRSTLKKFFVDGALPSPEQFHDLIDSTLNLGDEGFRKTPKEGLRISSQGVRDTLVSFSRDAEPTRVLWQIGFDEQRRDALTFGEPTRDATPEHRSGVPTLTLGHGGRVGINTVDPGCSLDVDGAVRMRRRLGTVPVRQPDDDQESAAAKEEGAPAPVIADGQWHNITALLHGCHALEVVAGVGDRGSGRYALLQTVAINAFNPRGFFFNFLGWKNRIRCRQSWYRSRADKLSLRWSGDDKGYTLQIRSNSDFGLGQDDRPVRIGYHVTELWDDPLMGGAATGAGP